MNDNKLKISGTALLLLVALGMGACEDPAATTVADKELQEIEADNVIFGMTSFMTASGVREGRVMADTAYVYTDSARIYLRKMELVFYHPDGRARATVTALGGEMDTNTDAMLAQGEVVLIVHEDGRRIETSELRYDPQRDRIWSDSATVQTMPDGTVTRGSAFESDMEFRNFVIREIRGGGSDIIF